MTCRVGHILSLHREAKPEKPTGALPLFTAVPKLFLSETQAGESEHRVGMAHTRLCMHMASSTQESSFSSNVSYSLSSHQDDRNEGEHAFDQWGTLPKCRTRIVSQAVLFQNLC